MEDLPIGKISVGISSAHRPNHHADDDDDDHDDHDDDLKEGKEIPRALLGQTFSTLFSIAAYSTCGC